MKKRILSMICVLALCLGLLPSAAFAADGDTAIMLGTNGISGYDDSTNSYDYIYLETGRRRINIPILARSNGGCWTTRPTQRNPAFSCSPTGCLEKATQLAAVCVLIVQARIATYGRAATRRRGAAPFTPVLFPKMNRAQYLQPQKPMRRILQENSHPTWNV